jgi:hypothetical protein
VNSRMNSGNAVNSVAAKVSCHKDLG